MDLTDKSSSCFKRISMNDFLDFLKITCQLNACTLDIDRTAVGDIDYRKLATNNIINGLLACQSKKSNDSPHSLNTEGKYEEITSETGKKKSLKVLGDKFLRFKINTSDKEIHPILKNKLDDVICEGILESIFPFICPPVIPNLEFTASKSLKMRTRDNSPNINLKASKAEDKKEGINEQMQFSSRSPCYAEGSFKPRDAKVSRRKSVAQPVDDKKLYSDIIIHVCDEVKNTSKDFSCPQNLLITKMGYFADVTAGQKLEDMDISVHCDIQIFEWLMKWVKKDTSQSDIWPQLDAANVAPILVSASFLQMEPLLLDCLSFCHSRLNEVVRASPNLSCLNDSIISRLAAMFTNLELEMVKDKKERVTPRLWAKMIQSLCEVEPQALRGHYFSLAGLYRCNKCSKYLTQSVNSFINCISSNTRLNRWGQLISLHSKDTYWNITNYIAVLFKELKSWRKVYWRLWGHCHYLYCCICETHFPANQMNWCQYHPELPQFLGPITEGRIAGPTGRHPCCGQQAFRYDTLTGPNGCQFREHSVIVENDRDRAILTLAHIAAEGNCLYEPAPAKTATYENHQPHWFGMPLMPTKCRQGLLPVLNIDEYSNKLSRRIRAGVPIFTESSSDTDTSDNSEKKQFRKTDLPCSSSEDCDTDSFKASKLYCRRLTKDTGRYWSGEMSARSNQDNQRDFEERIMKQIITMVGKTTGNETYVSTNAYNIGGAYVRLENEWKEEIKQTNLCKSKLK